MATYAAVFQTSLGTGPIEDVVPLLDDSASAIAWSNHNDIELRKQRTVLNLNNRNVRITLWCMIYMVFTAYAIIVNSREYIYHNSDHDTEWWDTDTDDEEQMRYYGLGVSTNVIIWWAVAILLCSLYCSCCNCNCNIFSVILIIIGTIVHFSTLAIGIDYDCQDNYWFQNENYCRVMFVGGSIFFGLFSLYLAVDIIKSIGDNIRVRLVSSSLFVALRSFLVFSYNLYQLGQINDLSAFNSRKHSFEFIFRTAAAASFECGFVCIVIIIMVLSGFGNQTSKIHPFIARLLGYCLLVGIGTYWASAYFVDELVPQFGNYWIVASFLIVYDLQYLKFSK